MKKYIFISMAALCLAGIGGVALAQDEIAPEETVTVQNLGVAEPGLLPTSPFYFFKEFGRGVRGLLTFNPVAKTELELKFANEKAAEAKKIIETQPQNAQAVQKALENYRKNQEKLMARLEGLKETSQNPNVDKLLNNLTEKLVKHEKLFDEIALKFKDNETIANSISKAKAKSDDIIGRAAHKDEPAKFASRLEAVLLKERGAELKHARSLEIIDRVSEKTPEAVKESLGRLREEFSQRLEADIKDLVEKEGDEAVADKLSKTPGDAAKRAVIMGEIKERAKDRMGQVLQKVTEQLETKIGQDKNIVQKAGEQIKRAEEIIGRAEAKNITSPPLTQAKEHLAKAKSAFEQKKYGEAFGQARSAEVLTRNALKAIEEQKPETQNFKQLFSELEEKINAYRNLLKERGYTELNNKAAFELLNNAVMHLGYAKESFGQNDTEKTKIHIGHTREFLAKLARLVEGKKLEAQIPEKSEMMNTKQTR